MTYVNIARIKGVNNFPQGAASSVSGRLRTVIAALRTVADMGMSTSTNFTTGLDGQTGRNAQKAIEELARRIGRHSETIAQIVAAREAAAAVAQKTMGQAAQVEMRVAKAEAVKQQELMAAYAASTTGAREAMIARALLNYQTTMQAIDSFAAGAIRAASAGTRSAIAKLPQLKDGGRPVAQSSNSQVSKAKEIVDAVAQMCQIPGEKEQSVSADFPGVGYDPSTRPSATVWNAKVPSPSLGSSTRVEVPGGSHSGFDLQGSKYSFGGASSAASTSLSGLGSHGSSFVKSIGAAVGIGSLAAAGGAIAYRNMSSAVGAPIPAGGGRAMAVGTAGSLTRGGVTTSARGVSQGVAGVRGAVAPMTRGGGVGGATTVSRAAAASPGRMAYGATTASRSSASARSGVRAGALGAGAGGRGSAGGRGVGSRPLSKAAAVARFGAQEKDKETPEELLESTFVEELTESTEITFVEAGGRTA